MFYGVCVALIYGMLCCAFIWYLSTSIPGLSAGHILSAYTPEMGLENIAAYIENDHVAFAQPAAILAFITRWPFMLIVATGCVCMTIHGLLQKTRVELLVTNQRILATSAGMMCRTTELPHHCVQELLFTQSFLGRVLNYGTIIIHDHTGVAAVIEYVESPAEFRDRAWEFVENKHKERPSAAHPNNLLR